MNIRKIFIIFSIFISCPAAFAESMVSEDLLKAAFIYHFISFTEWNDNEPNYNVCIPDDKGLRDAAEQSLVGKTVNNRKIVVSDQDHGCHVLISDNASQADNTLTIGHLNRGALFE